MPDFLRSAGAEAIGCSAGAGCNWTLAGEGGVKSGNGEMTLAPPGGVITTGRGVEGSAASRSGSSALRIQTLCFRNQ